MALILIIILIIVLVENDKLKKEISSLKRNNINYCPNCGFELNKTFESSTNNIPSTREVSKEITPKDEKPKMSDEGIKNNIILITGSILIILAAVIYLTSSWSITSNILKCVIIFIMFFVFVISSHIAKDKLNLKQTARAFNYIALAYLPLSLISVSIFGLLGENFSINGIYQNFYLSITLFICSIIYYVESKKDNDIFLSIATIISSIIGIIFFVRIFSTSFLLLLIFLYLYSYFLALLYDNKKYIYNEKFTHGIIEALFYILLVIVAVINLDIISYSDYDSIKMIENIILLIMNLELSIYLDNKVLNRYLVPISILLMFNSIRFIQDFKTHIDMLILLASVPCIYIYNFIKEKKINLFNFIFSSIIVFSVFMIDVVTFGERVIPLYVISLLYIGLLVITYLLNTNMRKAITWMIPIFIEITASLFTLEKELSVTILVGISTLLIFLSLLPIFKDKTKELVFIPTILNILYIMISFFDTKNIVMIFILVSVIVYFLLALRDNKYYKYLAYLFINIGTIYLGVLLLPESIVYALALPIVIIAAIEILSEKLKDDSSVAYILVNYFIAVLALEITYTILAFLMMVIISAALFVYLADSKRNKILYNVPLIIPVLFFFNTDLLEFSNFNYLIAIELIITLLIPLLFVKNKENIALVFVPYTYLLFMTTQDISLYVPYVLGLLISLVYYLYSDYKILFKCITMVASLLLYYQIIEDLSLDLTVFGIGILLIYALFITRNIMKNAKDKKVIEYLLFIFINIIAMSSYLGEADGMVYVVLLVLIMIFAYIKKYGPAFLVSIAFILINIFFLTRLFWLSLPWWLYVLGVGIILIIFAILNEINENKSVQNKLIDIKDKLDI